MAVYRVEVLSRPDSDQPPGDPHLRVLLRRAGLPELADITASRLFFFEGELTRGDAERLADALLRDPVTEQAAVLGAGDPAPASQPGQVALEVHPRPGVMDPVAESTRAELAAAGEPVEIVRTGRRYVLSGAMDEKAVVQTARRVLANDCVEQLVVGTAGVRPSPWPPVFDFKLRSVPVRDLDATALEQLSRAAHLFLSRDEMLALQQHFRTIGREPTDLEIEAIAQTWSEHCVHKTLRSAVAYQGAPLPGPRAPGRTKSRGKATTTVRYGNLLKDTIIRATEELLTTRRGPACLSVFKDNAGVIAFDDEYAVAFKVETHNHPSAIEPYGGAATGIGGVIRDVIGCGLGAKPVANTDVFCVAPSDWPYDALPKGVLHPRRVLEGIVAGVADYGNRMGIPTVNGAVYFDPRYLGNPLVYCGCLGLLPRRLVDKTACPGDLIVVVGGRTGRDGIHGATFSSAELTDTHADEFSHAVQIGNAITEKCVLDAVLQARDAEGGCLYTAITDCGAGGLSSAVGEMGVEIGAVVDLEKVPLKYAGLRYDEIWISEAQERMVVAVPPDRRARFMDIMAAEGVEATVIGVFGTARTDVDEAGPPLPAEGGGPRLVLRFEGQQVGDLDLRFLHDGLPKLERAAEWSPPAPPRAPRKRNVARRPDELVARLLTELRRPNVAAKTWIIRRYDHEVQGGSVVKPLLGPGGGPGDAAVLRPRLGSKRGVALGCGLAPHVADLDPYWMAVASIDEALRNVVCVGGDLSQTALLDNFCWARSDDPQQLGALVRACQACYDVAIANGTPFISGKDSLNNEFALDAADVERLIETLRGCAAGTDVDAERLRAILPVLEERLRLRGRLAIPPTLLISALSIVPDVRRCLTPDLKRPGARLLLVGGLPLTGHAVADAAAVHRAVAGLLAAGHAAACHDVSDGGWLVALAEMAFAGNLGVDIDEGAAARLAPFEECCAGYVVEAVDLAAARATLHSADVAYSEIGTVRSDDLLCWKDARVDLATLCAAWRGEEEQRDKNR